MKAPQEISQATTNYGGLFHWNAFTDAYTSTNYPAIEVELFIKEHSIPARKKNTSEINTPSYYDSHSDMDVGVNAIFEGAPDLLSVSISGMLRTPTTNGYYTPRDVTNTPVLPLLGVHYGEVVMLMISGEINRTAGGAFQRKDPTYFIDGYGNRYDNPVIQTWEAASVAGSPKHQSFTAQILLEY